MAVQLTEGAIKALYENDLSSSVTQQPILQVINIKAVPAPQGTRYRVIISDGINFMQAMLASQHTQLVESKKLLRYSIIRLKESVCNELHGRKILIILNLDIVELEVPSRIGSPTTLESHAANSSAADSTSSPASSSPAQSLFTTTSGPSTTNGMASATTTSTSAPARSNPYLESSLFPIKALNPYQNKWTIKARVTQKSEIKHWHNARSDGKLFSVNLLDNSGEIKATAFHDQVDRLYHLFEEGKVYYISKARVTMARKQWSTLDNEYELSLDNGTEVEVCPDESSIPKMNYNFVRLADLDHFEKGSVVDVIAVVKDDNGVQEIVSKNTGRPTKKRELIVVDDSMKQIRLTLWDRPAEEFDSSGAPVVAFKGLRVNDFGGRSLSLSLGGLIKTNPDIPECARLRQWYGTQGANASFSAFAQNANGNIGQRSNTKITLQKVKDDGLGMGDRTDYFSTRATVVFIKHDPACYASCPDCRKKVVQEAVGWRCEKCSKTLDEPTWRYILTVSIEDYTAQLFVNVFDEIGTIILGMPAGELMALRENDADAYSKAFSNALFKTYNLKCRAKTETFNDTTRTKYQIFEATLVNFIEESKEMVAAIEKMLE